MLWEWTYLETQLLSWPFLKKKIKNTIPLLLTFPYFHAPSPLHNGGMGGHLVQHCLHDLK